MFRIALEEFGSPTAAAGRLEFVLESSDRLSVRELIQRTVAREIELRGLEVGPLELDKQKNEATQAFAHGTFAMLVDGEQISDLDQLFPADDGREIVFIRIHPMVGG